MSRRNNNIFGRIGGFMFMLISVLSILFIVITYLAVTHFHEAATQLLNKDVAAHIAKFTSPFEGLKVNKEKADSVFYHTMVVSPNAEVYFLDTSGKVIYYHAADSSIKNWHVPLGNIKKHIRSGGTDYIKGLDPKQPSSYKIFSAAEVRDSIKTLGYIYVILGSSEYRNVADVLFRSHVIRLVVQAFIIILIVTFLLTLLYFKRLQRNFNKVISTLDQFKQGNYNARFDLTNRNELNTIMAAFNDLAEKLDINIARLRQSETERQDFITNISHDLRTPLSIAKGYTETLLLHEGQNQQFTEYLQLIEIKIQQVENLVMQLFELSKIESVEFKPNKEPFVIGEILKEIVDNWQLPAQRKNIDLNCLGCQNNAMIFADISMMERVIQNLLDNAVKYSPEKGGITVELEKKGDELELTVSNTGTPLPPGIIEWIVTEDPGNRIVKRPVKSGLGLTIIQKILRLHDYPLTIKTDQKNRISFRMKIYTK